MSFYYYGVAADIDFGIGIPVTGICYIQYEASWRTYYTYWLPNLSHI